MASTAFAGEMLTASPRIGEGNVIALPEAVAGMEIEVGVPSRASAITEPTGEKKEYIYSSTGFSRSILGATPGKTDGVTDIVWDRDNNKAYIHHPLGGVATAYVEGTIAADGKTITVQLPQLVGFLTGYDEDQDPVLLPLYVSVMQKVSAGGDGIDYVPVSNDQNVAVYSVSEDGNVVTMTSPYQADFDTNAQGQQLMPEKYLTAYYEHNKSLWDILQPGEQDVVIQDWYIYGCLNMKYDSQLPDDAIVYDIPNNLNWEEDWRISGTNGSRKMCKVAIQDDKFYVGNLIDGANAVIVGTLKGDQVTFKNNQYMGIHPQANKFMLLQGVDSKQEYDADNREYYLVYELNGQDMVFNWDADNNELVFEGANKGMVLNSSFVRVLYYDVYNEPEIVKQANSELCVAPERPGLDGWWPSNPGTHLLSMVFSNIATSGAVLEKENLYWSMYLDGEPFTFLQSKYRLGKDMVEVPITLNKGKVSIIGGITYVSIFDEDFEGKSELSVCTINHAPNGEQYYSAMTTIKLEGGGVGIQQVEAEDMPTSVRFVDMQGREVKAPVAGQMLIKVATYADGTTRASKVVK